MERRANSASKRLPSPSLDGKFARLYDLEETIGKGHYAVVKLARHVFTGERVAVKVIDKTRLDEASKAQLYQEIRCMKMVQHPIVVRLYEVIDTQTKLYLVLEYGDGGDLYDYIMKHEHGVDEGTAKRYFRQVIRAISYCHQLHVVHRDLKPENVVFFKKLGLVKLTDFGFSNKFNPGQKLATSCGSLAYSAPEILLGDQYDAPAVDIWSLGVILYMLVCGRPPFQEATDNETLTMIMDCKYSIPSHVSRDCRRLITRMLQRDPSKRATLQSIAEDSWLCEPGDSSKYEDYLPLVSRHHLNDDEHTEIMGEMVNGGVASEEEILACLEKDDYNHVTATYYLLAEKRLRSRRLETLRSLSAQEKQKQDQQKPDPPRRRSITSRSDSVCSLTKTKSAENILSDDDAGGGSSDGGRRCDPSSLDDLDALKTALKEDSPSSSSSTGSSPARGGGRDRGSMGGKSMTLPLTRKLHPVKSSPQLVLNEICEEDESDGTSDGSKGVQHPPTSIFPSRRPSLQKSTALRPATIGIGPSTGARCRLTKRQFTRKLPSCSSSDASDEDSEVKAKKNPFLWRRRDSQEDSSDDPGSVSANGTRRNVAKFPPPLPQPLPPAPLSSSSSSSTPQQGVPETIAEIREVKEEIAGKMCLQRRHSSNDVWRSRSAGRRLSVMRQSQSLSRIGELHVLILDATKTKRAASADGFATSRPRIPIQQTTTPSTGPRVVLSTSRHNSDSESNTEDVGAVAAVSSHTKRRHHHRHSPHGHHHSVAGKENDGRRLVPVPEAGEQKEKEEALSTTSTSNPTSTGKKRGKIKAFLDKRRGNTSKGAKNHHQQHERGEHEAFGGGKACNMT